MKFFPKISIPISSSPFRNWVFPYGAQDILEPFHRLFYPYSMRHNQPPRNDDPNMFSPMREILVAKDERFGLSTSLPKHLCLKMAGIQCAYEYDLYLQHLLKSGRSQNCIFVSKDLDSDIGDHLLVYHIDTWSPKQDGNSYCLQNVNSYEYQPFNKTKKFIETKVTAINCRVLTFN